MKKKDYWTKRKAQRMVDEMDQAEQVSKQFDEIYNLASRQITSKIDQIFESYRRSHGLTETEAKRILSQADSLNIQDLKRALQNTTDSEEVQQILTLLDSAPYASRIERYESLRTQVDDLPAQLFKDEQRVSRSFYGDLVSDAYYHSIFDLQQQSGIGFSFNPIDAKEIKEVMAKPWLGANYSQRIWGNTQQLANELQRELAVSLLTGRSADETADFINAKFNKGKSNARRLVRTEANHFHAEMEGKAYEEAEVEHYQFLATLDMRTSSICREHDGNIYSVKERRTGVNYPPLHPWCRSDTIAVEDEEWLKTLKRSARDPKTGKTIQVPADMTYDDWYDKHVKPLYKVDSLKQSDIYRASQQYDEFKAILGDERTPKTLADFVDLKYNKPVEYECFKDKAYIQKHFNNGTWSDKINPEKQGRHIKATAGVGKSYFFDDVDVNALYEKYKMTGRMLKNKKGRTHKEIVDLPSSLQIGIDVYSGKVANGLTIHYGKTGSHIIPTYYEEE